MSLPASTGLGVPDLLVMAKSARAWTLTVAAIVWLSTVALIVCVPSEVPVKVAVAWQPTNCMLAPEREPCVAPLRVKIVAGGTGNAGRLLRLLAGVVMPLERPKMSAVSVELLLMKIVPGLALFRSCSQGAEVIAPFPAMSLAAGPELAPHQFFVASRMALLPTTPYTPL